MITPRELSLALLLVCAACQTSESGHDDQLDQTAGNIPVLIFATIGGIT